MEARSSLLGETFMGETLMIKVERLLEFLSRRSNPMRGRAGSLDEL